MVFATYYQKLYGQPEHVEPALIDDFLDFMPLRKITPEAKEEIGGIMTAQELKVTLKKMARGKVAGIDGLPMEFYPKFEGLLMQRLAEVYNAAWESNTLPQTLTIALMVALPKKGRDTVDPASYRLLSMLTTDYKLLRDRKSVV